MIGLLTPHGDTDPVGGWLGGRRPGVTLNETGRAQTPQLVQQALKWAPVCAVYTSPLERAVETAHPLAPDHGLDLRVRPVLIDIDIDVGAWTGRAVDELADDPEWRRFNSERSLGRPPAASGSAKFNAGVSTN